MPRDDACRTTADAPAPTDRPRRRRALLTLAALVVLGVAVWLIVGEVASFGRVVDALRRANPWWLALCLVGQAISWVAYSFLYRAVARVDGGPQPSFGAAVRVTIASFGAFLLATSVGSLAVDYWALRRMCEPGAAAAARVLAIDTAQWAILACGAALGAVALLAGAGPHAPLWLELSWALGFAALTAGAAWFSAPARRRWARDEGGRPRRAVAAGIRAVVLLRDVLHSPRDRRWALWGGALYWAGELLTAWAALRAFGVSLGPAALVLAYATGFAANVLPLPAGSAGAADAAYTFALTLVGVPLPVAVLGMFAARVFSFWLPILPGAVAAASLGRMRGDLARAGSGRARRPQAAAADTSA